MLSDRELLELAAKAAGIPIVPCTCNDKRWPFAHNHAASGKYGHWNPLIHDGDALRPAVKLGLRACIDNSTGFSWIKKFEGSIAHGDDPEAATRRAIVRAAAEIGRSTP